jgi:4-hydroxy-4-methyl-2-oxoglutarate aldolase
MADDFLTRLQQLDACAVSDAMDSLGIPGAVTGIERRATSARIAGRVVTVKLGATKIADAPTRHLGTGAIEAAEQGDVIVVEQSAVADVAGWGGVLSNAAQVRGIAGAIVEGPARDIDEANEIAFPVFSRSTTCRTARGRIWEQSFNTQITVGNVEVMPGCYVIADASGTVFVPEERMTEVLELAEFIVQKEQAMTKAVRAGEAPSAVMGADYEKMLREDH